MGILRTNTISGIGTDGPVFDGVTRLDTFGYVVPPVGVTSDRTLAGVTTAQGSIRFNTDSQKLEFFAQDAQDQWWEMVIDTPDLAVSSNTGAGARGVFAGGYTNVPAGSTTNAIEYITISSTGNSTDFGDLSSSRQDAHSCASSTRGLFATVADNRIDYVTISSTGNSQDFGDIITTNKRYSSATGNSTRGIWGGGGNPALYNTVEYVTISSLGNGVDFGDLTTSRESLGACSSPVRGVFGGGRTPTLLNIVDYIIIATLGNAFDFGDLTSPNQFVTACSNSTRGLFGGGYAPTVTNTIQYITISTIGNAIDFGDLTVSRAAAAACSSPTRGVFGGGNFSGTDSNVLDYVTISTQSNAVDFGDLTQSTATRIKGACSNAHGGL